jgi:multiple sugar transport system permease protein
MILNRISILNYKNIEQADQTFSPKLNCFFGQNGMVVYGQLAAYSALYALPSIILYVLSQSYMSKGFNLSGAAKG